MHLKLNKNVTFQDSNTKIPKNNSGFRFKNSKNRYKLKMRRTPTHFELVDWLYLLLLCDIECRSRALTYEKKFKYREVSGQQKYMWPSGVSESNQ